MPLASVSGFLPRPNLVVGPGMFRAILALLVFVSHTSKFNVGKIAVMMFFLLSGYWVTSIWRKQFSTSNWLLFYASRYLRIIPIYFLVIVIAAVLLDRSIFPNILLFGIASMPDRDIISVSWSLDIELQFYAILPVFLTFIDKVGAKEIAVSMILAVIGGIIWAQTGITSVLTFLPAFALGAYIYDNKYNPPERIAKISLLAFLVVTLLLAVLPATQALMVKTREVPEGSDVFSMLWMLPLIPYIASSLHKRSDQIDRHLGNLSYPFYLVHTVVIAGLRIGFQGIILKILALVVTGVVSLVIYWAVDRPAEKLRHRLLSPSA